MRCEDPRCKTLNIRNTGRGNVCHTSCPTYSARGYSRRSSGQCTTKRSANKYIMRPVKLSDLTRQKLSQNTVREQLEPSPKNRKATAAKHTGMHVPVARWKDGF